MPSPPLPLPYRYPNIGPFWVSPSGSDTVGDGSQGNPWRNPQKAADFIRTNRLNSSQYGDITINILPGAYAPLALTHLDSAYNGHAVKYVSTGGPGAAVFSTGTQITNWTQVSGSLFKAPVPNTFWTVYENGIRSIMARTPKFVPDPSFPMARTPYFSAQSDSITNSRLLYNPVDFDPSSWPLGDIGVMEWSGGTWQWATDTNTVASVDTVGHAINFANLSKFPLYQPSRGSRYFIQGIQALVTNPGEWYLDRAGGFLYYIARDGDIHNQAIVVPSAPEAITLTGLSAKDGERVTGVTLDGVCAQYTDFVQWYRPGWPVLGAGNIAYPTPVPWIYPFYSWLAVMPQFQLGAIRLTNTDHCTLTNFKVQNAGMYGVFVNGYGQQNAFTNFWVNQIGCSGFRFDGQFPGLGDIVNNNTIQNFQINNVGELSGTASGIDIAQSGSNLIKYGYIYNSPRKAVWVLATTGQNALLNTIYTRNNLIDHVKMQYLCQDSGDTGGLGFDSLSSISPNLVQNTVQQVIIDSVIANSSMLDIAPVGILCDDQTTGQILTDVQVTNTQAAQLKVNADGSNPILTNCSFQLDGSTNPSFDPSQMDTANIGTQAGFPY